MGRRSGLYKFTGFIVIFILLFHGICVGEAKNETNVGIDDKISDKLSGKIVVNVNSTINDTTNQTLFAVINGTINGTVNDAINGTVTGNINGTIYDATNGTVIGTINGPVNGTVEGTVNKTQTFEWLLLIPLFAASLLFLCWISRFFDKMNFCLVGLVLLAFLFWAFSFDFVSNEIRPILMGLILVLIFIVVIHEIFLKDKNEDKGNPVMNLKDIIRNLTTILIVIIWPLILYHFYRNGIEEIKFYGTEKTNFPVYIIAASYIGVLSYLFLSIEESFGHLMPEYKKISIAWAYLRRIFIAPFIAIIGFYVLNALQNRDINDYFIFVFSFFAGVFTKTIEEWIYAWVQKLLPDPKQQEFNARTQYEVKETDFVKILGCDEDLAYMLYNAKIRTIEELATFEGNEAELMKKVNLDTRNIGEGTGCLLKSRPDTLGSYTQKQLQLYICRAKCFTEMCKKSDLSKKLHMDRHLAFKLCALAGITTFDDLINCDPEKVHKKACYYTDYPQETHDKLCDCQEKEIIKFIEEAKKKKEKEIAKKKKEKEIELKPQKDGTTERDVQKELETQVWIKFWEFLSK